MRLEVSRRVKRIWRVVCGERGRGKAMCFAGVDGGRSCTPWLSSDGPFCSRKDIAVEDERCFAMSKNEEGTHASKACCISVAQFFDTPIQVGEIIPQSAHKISTLRYRRLVVK